jgi:hypothetical protein
MGKAKAVNKWQGTNVGQMGNMDIPFTIATIVTLYIPIFNSLNQLNIIIHNIHIEVW